MLLNIYIYNNNYFKKKYGMNKNIDDIIKKFEKEKFNVKSEFLDEFFTNEEKRRKMGYNPRDPLGRRLSLYWK